MASTGRPSDWLLPTFTFSLTHNLILLIFRLVQLEGSNSRVLG